MIQEFSRLVAAHRTVAETLFRRCLATGEPVLPRSRVQQVVDAYCEERHADGDACPDELRRLVDMIQEALATSTDLHLALRARVANWNYLHIHVDTGHLREIDVSEYLQFKETLAGGRVEHDALEIDLSPFERGFPKLTDVRSIGRGVEFLNRHLSGRLFDRRHEGGSLLFRFLTLHQVQGRQLMLNDLLQDAEALRAALHAAIDLLEEREPATPWPEVAADLKRLGFEPGWGRDARTALDGMALLADILEAPSPDALERFLARVPMLFNVAILSPHGYFGQSGVLGMPDTGGQVVYILDQVRALEYEMMRSHEAMGLDLEPQIVVITRLLRDAEGTACDQMLEPIHGTRNARILRVPFREADGREVPHWISRFDIWPYLERFARDAEQALLAELGARPDLIIGNYSDGNFVSSLMSRSLGVTQCTIAHALEKSKYAESDLHWRDRYAAQHFGCQFTADLIAMNTADFIIASTYQEIAGTPSVVGQYEGYGAFTLPGLYRVVEGIDPFDPKFNIVSPGADPTVFFPFTEAAARGAELTAAASALIDGGEGPEALGEFADKERPPLFAMSRLDRIKNMSGLVDLYGRSDALRDRANLLIAGGFHDPAESQDDDEKAQIERIHELIANHGLAGQIRWLTMRADKAQVGELYRCVADRRGAFVQPALYEAFGLTVVEAMASGLPTFATRHGGPLEIIEDGVSGFHIDPERPEETAARLTEGLQDFVRDPESWERISTGALRRIESRYNWPLYASRLLTLSRVYGFWKFMTNIERDETRRYLDMFRVLVYRRLAEEVGTGA
ncbi:MAG TPA: sucrose synthase [Candidatus Krumholzibacteria bacterium]|nr:sucrose synthase [Candidatus Krumholzibacteria bacterium]